MAAIDFPTSPTIGQTFTLSNKTWKFDGTSWITAASSNLSLIENTIGSTNTNGNILLSPNGTGQVVANTIINATQFISNITTGTAPLTVTSTTQVANLNAATAGSATTAATVTTAAQPNITSVGTLTSITVGASGITFSDTSVQTSAGASTGKAIAMAIVFG